MTLQATLLRFVRSKTSRLALSYLSIIMLLCLGFSSASYLIASKIVNPKLAPPSSTHSTHEPQVGQDSILDSNSAAANHKDRDGVKRAAAAQTVDPKLVPLRKALIILNLAALVLGSVVSYYLARRTLRPIEAAMEAQSRFASDASHELRTPLTIMQLEIENALTKSNFPASARKLLESNLEEVKHLKELSDGLLRIARQSPILKLSPLWADEIVSLAVNRVASQVQVKNMAIIDFAPHAQVLADKQSLVEVLVILLENAVKYGKEATSIHIEGRIDRKYAYLAVRDEGSGIEASDLPHIFERFYRSEMSRRQQPGQGLGLSIAQALMQRQRGKISAESIPGQGSTLTLKLTAYRSK
jgi:two-component system sensor histidine kinase CiaH